VNIEGAGRENLLNAVNAKVGLSPVSVSFGAIPSGAGQTKSVAISLTNLTGAPATWSLGIANTTGSGVSYSLSASSVTLAAGASASVNVKLTATKGASGGDHQAWLTVSSGGTLVAHAAVYAIVK
jgi:minor extracellular serine protease Vpr